MIDRTSKEYRELVAYMRRFNHGMSEEVADALVFATTERLLSTDAADELKKLDIDPAHFRSYVQLLKAVANNVGEGRGSLVRLRKLCRNVDEVNTVLCVGRGLRLKADGKPAPIKKRSR